MVLRRELHELRHQCLQAGVDAHLDVEVGHIAVAAREGQQQRLGVESESFGEGGAAVEDAVELVNLEERVGCDALALRIDEGGDVGDQVAGDKVMHLVNVDRNALDAGSVDVVNSPGSVLPSPSRSRQSLSCPQIGSSGAIAPSRLVS